MQLSILFAVVLSHMFESPFIILEKELLVFDASTKIPEGIYAGTLTHLGNFDECLEVDAEVFYGKHCLITLAVDTSRMEKETLLLNREVANMLTQAQLTVSLCVPSTCSPKDAALYMEELLKSFSSIIPVTLQADASDLTCHTKDEPSYRPEDWVAVGIYSCCGVLVVLSTIYDVLQKKSESRSNLLVAFSVYSNGKKLLATSSGGDTLGVVHGIRFISMAWVVLGHRYSIESSMPTINQLRIMTEYVPDWKRLGMTNGTLSVDPFFVLSGLLVSYVFFLQIPKQKSFNIPLYYLHRYIRLTPAIAAMVLLEATLFRYAGSGPLWDSSNTVAESSCKDYWWSALLYVQNFVNPMNVCVGQSWYLAVDMQLHWLSPLVLIPLWKWPRVGGLLIGALTVGGLIGNYIISYNYRLAGSMLNIAAMGQTELYQKAMYVPTYTRFIPYLTGVALGYLLLELKMKRITVKLSPWKACAMWLVTAALLLTSLCTIQVFHETDYVYEPVGAAMYNALGRPVWGLGVAFVIFLCSTGNGGFINTVLSWEGFQPLSRLSYSIYLVHPVVQQMQYGATRTQSYFSDINTFPKFFGDMVFSTFCAVALSLVFESPFMILEKELLGGKKIQKPEAPIKNPEAPTENPGTKE